MSVQPPKSVAIVGAGITGLTLAHDLARRGFRVEVFEAQGNVGGELAVLEVGGASVERYYHHLFVGDTEIVGLMRELGIDGRLEWNTPPMGFYAGGALHPFTTPIDLLRFKPLSPAARVRMAIATMRLRRVRDFAVFEDLTAADYLPRLVGREGFDTLWKPLLRAKFGEQWPEVSMAWFWGRVHVRFKSRTRTGFRERLGYVRGSFRAITEALETAARGLGVRFHLQTPVEAVVVDGGRASGLRVRGESRQFDFAIATVGLPVIRRLLASNQIAGDLGAIAYRGALVMLMRLNESVSRFYWTNIAGEGIPFAGLIEHTNFISRERYGGARLLYVSNYVPASERLFNLSDSELFEDYAPHIARIFPKFSPRLVEEYWVSRDPVAQPVITAGYQRRIPPFRSPLPGFYICNTSQIYPEDRGTNYNVRIARRCAALVCEDAGIDYAGFAASVAPR